MHRTMNITIPVVVRSPRLIANVVRLAVILTLPYFTMRSYATVEAVLLRLTPTNSYSVPAGKVLLIENIVSEYGHLVLELDSNTKLSISPQNFSTSGPVLADPRPLNLPLKIPGGWKVLSQTNEFGSGLSLTWIF